jgi:formylglycine-generating enzyme required for sulfatase activity
LFLISCGDDNDSPTTNNQDITPPDLSGLTNSPSDLATDVSLIAPLEWSEASDAGSGVDHYRVLLDGISPPVTEVYSGTLLEFATDPLSPMTTYYWQVVAVDAAGNESHSEIWSFTTTVLDDFESINPGTFLMGSPLTELPREPDEQQHQVTLTRGYWMSPTTVTEQWWDEVMGTGESTSQLPKMMVTWYEALEFCNALSELKGLAPAYTGSGTDWTWNQDADGYRLPTEAEWEYACRAGTTGPFFTGGCIDGGTEANLNGTVPYTNCLESTFLGERQDVRTYLPNPWGLYEMHGNIMEWCWDGYADYPEDPVTDPVGVGPERVLRGGFWFSIAFDCRSASRVANSPATATVGWGFRPERND